MVVFEVLGVVQSGMAEEEEGWFTRWWGWVSMMGVAERGGRELLRAMRMMGLVGKYMVEKCDGYGLM